MSQDKDLIRFTLFKTSSSIRDFLTETNNLTRSWIKKFELPKAFLESPAQKGKEIELPADLINRSMISPVYEGGGCRSLSSKGGVYAFHKAVGDNCFPLRYSSKKNLLSWIRQEGKWPGILEFNSEDPQRGLLNRIDDVTSGLLLMTDSSVIFDSVARERDKIFKSKLYLAIVPRMGKKHIQLNDQIQNTSAGAVKVNVGKGENVTLEAFEVISNEKYTLLLVSLGKGVRHQIRAQLSAAGYPIVGDSLYKGEKAGRVYLHCFEYVLELDGKIEIFSDYLISDFELFLDSDGLLDVICDQCRIIQGG